MIKGDIIRDAQERRVGKSFKWNLMDFYFFFIFVFIEIDYIIFLLCILLLYPFLLSSI